MLVEWGTGKSLSTTIYILTPADAGNGTCSIQSAVGMLSTSSLRARQLSACNSAYLTRS